MTKDPSKTIHRGRKYKSIEEIKTLDFSGHDICGTDFTGIDLTGANFQNAEAGLQKRWVAFLVCVSFLLSAISGLFSAFAGALISLISDSSSLEKLIGWTVLVVIIFVFSVVLIKGLDLAITIAGIIAYIIAGAGAIMAIVKLLFAFAIAVIKAFNGVEAFTVTVIGREAITGAITIAAIFAGAGAIAGAIAFAVTVAGAFAVAIAFAVAVAGAGAGVGAAVVAGAIALIGAIGGAITFDGGVDVAIAFAGTGVSVSAYIAWSAIEGDERYALIRDIAVAFAATGGTKFYKANLTNADFTAATLKSTDFREANLTHTCFYQTDKLELARTGITYLQKAKVRQLLVKGKGENENFDHENLRGINLRNAKLQKASFVDTDLREADLQNADLSNAIFQQTKINQTDFTNAILTGACIDNWHITSSTKLDNVDCEFFFTDIEKHLRKPDNDKSLEKGEFGDFIKPILDTLDIYHTQDFDPYAITTAFKQLTQDYSDAELELVAIERRGKDRILLRVKTAVTVNKLELKEKYFLSYDSCKKSYNTSIETKSTELMSSRTSNIKFYEKVKTITTNIYNDFRSIINNNQRNIEVNTMIYDSSRNTDSSRKIGNINTGRDFTPSGQSLNLGEISGIVASTINQLPTTDPEKQGIKEALTKLQEAIEADETLTVKNKEKALKQVKALAEVSKNPKDEKNRDLADDAITMLKGLISGLPAAATLVETWNKLLPMISTFIGIG